MVEVTFSSAFKRLKKLSKCYRQIRKDIEPTVVELQRGHTLGDQIVGTSIVAFKVRVRNSDIPTGKSGGYRLVYQTLSPENVVLMSIYPKSEQEDIKVEAIEKAAKQVQEELEP